MRVEPTLCYGHPAVSELRHVPLDRGEPGRLLLYSMPGRHEALDSALAWMTLEGVTLVACLPSDTEIAEANEEYLAAIRARDPRLPQILRSPAGRARGASNRALARRLSAAIGDGAVVLIHCIYGNARTPALARAVLRELGYPPGEADDRVTRAAARR